MRAPWDGAAAARTPARRLTIAVREPEKEDESAEFVFCRTAKRPTVIVRWQAASVGRRLPQVSNTAAIKNLAFLLTPAKGNSLASRL